MKNAEGKNGYMKGVLNNPTGPSPQGYVPSKPPVRRPADFANAVRRAGQLAKAMYPKWPGGEGYTMAVSETWQPGDGDTPKNPTPVNQGPTLEEGLRAIRTGMEEVERSHCLCAPYLPVHIHYVYPMMVCIHCIDPGDIKTREQASLIFDHAFTKAGCVVVEVKFYSARSKVTWINGGDLRPVESSLVGVEGCILIAASQNLYYLAKGNSGDPNQ